MTPTRITVRHGYTANVGNYETERIDLGIEEDVPEGESVKDCIKRNYDFLTHGLEVLVKEAKRDAGA